MKILDFYKGLLTTLRYQFNDDGLISISTPTGSSKPATVEGKRLVLPTSKFMRDGFGEDYQPFHPLSESIARRGTSPVLQHLQRQAKANLAHSFVYLAQQLLTVAAEPALHKDLPPDCADFLKKLSNADKKTVQIFDQVVRAAIKKNKLITVYLKNGGKYNGKPVNRMAVIRFPIIELIDQVDDTELGVEMSKKHRQTLSALFRMVMPFGDSPEEYSAGSNNRTAPYLHAFLQAYRKVALQMNRIIERYGKPLELSLSVFELYSEKSLAGFGEMYDQLPVLSGNEGKAHEEDEQEVEEVKVNRSGPTDVYEAMDHKPSKPAAAQPKVLNQPATAKASEGIELSDLLKQMNIQPQAPQPQYNTGYQANQGYHQNLYQSYQQPNPLAQLNAIAGGGQVMQQQQPMNPYAQAVMSHQQSTMQQPVNHGYTTNSLL